MSKAIIDTGRILPVNKTGDWQHYGAGHRWYFVSYITGQRIYAITMKAIIHALRYETEREQAQGELREDMAADGFAVKGGCNVE